ncbi:MAG: hypothetical protein A2V64_10075 [Bacteroidetes bacterium RBG_13_43_22]|nr:MAG: hypothetical protein A2V64_10075 [Bacteroidetes bacterium RBG_13_43_22]
MLNLITLKPFFMKKQTLIIIILIITALQIYGQKTKDALYLKNGSKIYGKLVEADSLHYKFQTSDGSVMIYPIREVEKFAKEAPYFDGRKTEAFSFSLEAGFLVGPQNSRYNAPFSFDFIAGYTFITNTTLSLGSGVFFVGRPFTPIVAEFRQVLYDRKTSPYIFIRGGGIVPFGGDGVEENPDYYYNQDYNIPKNYKGGGSFLAGTGISWAYEDYEFNLSFAYRYAHFTYEEREYNLGEVTYKENLNRLEIKLGFRF